MRALTAERSARAGGVILVIRFATGAVLNYAFGVALTWLIAPASFGTVAALQNVLLLATGVLTAGFPWVLALRLAAAPDPAEARADFRTALVGNTAIGLLLAAGFVGLQLAGVRLVPTDSLPLVLTIGAEIVVLAVNAVLVGALQGTKRFGGLGAMQSTEILVKCAVATVLVVALGLSTEGVALGFLAGSVVATVIAVRALAGTLPGPGRLGSLRLLSAAGPFWVATAGFTFLLTADVLGLNVVGAASGITAGAIALYQACSILARAGYFVADALADAVFPFMTEHRASRYHSHRWMLAASRWIPLVIVPLLLVMAVVPGRLLGLFFPSSYAASAGVLRLLAVGTLGIIVLNTLVKAMFALDRARVAAAVMPFAVAVEVVALLVLIPSHGLAGAAGASALAGWFGALVLLVAYVRVQRPEPLPRALIGRYLAALLPTAALLGLAALVDGVASWALIVAAGVAYVVLVDRLGLLGAEYTDRVRQPVRSVARRLRGAPSTPTEHLAGSSAGRDHAD